MTVWRASDMPRRWTRWVCRRLKVPREMLDVSLCGRRDVLPVIPAADMLGALAGSRTIRRKHLSEERTHLPSEGASGRDAGGGLAPQAPYP